METNRLHEDEIEIIPGHKEDQTHYSLVLPSKYAGNFYAIPLMVYSMEAARAERRQLVEFLREWGVVA